MSTDCAQRWRFNTSLLRDAIFVNQLEVGLSEFVAFNEHSVEDARVLWDSVKGYIQSNCISFASNLNKIRQRRVSELERDLDQLECAMQNEVSLDLTTQHKKVKDELDWLY